MTTFNEMKGDLISACICRLIGTWPSSMICSLFIAPLHCVFMKGRSFFDSLEGSYSEGETNPSLDFTVD